MADVQKIRQELAKMEQALGYLIGDGDLTPTPLPILCPSNVPNPSEVPEAEFLCQVRARLSYFARVLGCVAQPDPATCYNEACSDYDDASEDCEG